MADLIGFVVSQFSDGEEDPAATGDGGREINAQEVLATIGLSVRFPGCRGNGAQEYWEMLCRGKDMIQEVPLERWDVDAYFDEDHAAPGKMYSRNGGFIIGLEEFDSKMFGIVEGEARAMDPHQRILLELVYLECWSVKRSID